jgi:DNA-binding response OmpR family regulator
VAPSAHPVLVVEDDPDLLLMLATALELEGQHVITATNGMEAFDLAQLHHPSLIVLDLMLPVISGEAFRQAQLANAAISSIPVLVVSARHDAEAVAERMHAVGCLAKPVNLDTFSALVKRFVGLRTEEETEVSEIHTEKRRNGGRTEGD